MKCVGLAFFLVFTQFQVDIFLGGGGIIQFNELTFPQPLGRDKCIDSFIDFDYNLHFSTEIEYTFLELHR